MRGTGGKCVNRWKRDVSGLECCRFFKDREKEMLQCAEAVFGTFYQLGWIVGKTDKHTHPHIKIDR